MPDRFTKKATKVSKGYKEGVGLGHFMSLRSIIVVLIINRVCVIEDINYLKKISS